MAAARVASRSTAVGNSISAEGAAAAAPHRHADQRSAGRPPVSDARISRSLRRRHRIQCRGILVVREGLGGPHSYASVGSSNDGV